MEADALLAPLLLVKIGLYSSALIAGGLALHGALGIVECGRLATIRRLAAVAAGSALLFGECASFSSTLNSVQALQTLSTAPISLGPGECKAPRRWRWRRARLRCSSLSCSTPES